MEQKFNERQKQILDQLRTYGEVKITELKDSYSVTEMTIRRDLEKLEQLGLAKRTFGGAILAPSDIELRERSGVRFAEKNRIGRKAAEMIKPGDSIYIDSGSTTLQVVHHLPYKAEITAVTNAINIAEELMAKKIPTIVLGGILIETTSSMVGPNAIEAISRMAFDKVFLGATGINPTHGFSNSNMYEAEIKRIAIQKTSEAFVVLDRSKFGERALVSFASLSDVQSIITDQRPDYSLLTACKISGLEVVIA
jgi:DeoR family fructose operon transcriptional repressor